MTNDMTTGSPIKLIIKFMIPMCLGNIFQQFYNIADTLIIGRFVGAEALAAVGSSYTLMTFLTSILLGLSMGSGVAVSIAYGKGDTDQMKEQVFLSFVMIGLTSVVLSVLAFAGIDWILDVLQKKDSVRL